MNLKLSLNIKEPINDPDSLFRESTYNNFRNFQSNQNLSKNQLPINSKKLQKKNNDQQNIIKMYNRDNLFNRSLDITNTNTKSKTKLPRYAQSPFMSNSNNRNQS